MTTINSLTSDGADAGAAPRILVTRHGRQMATDVVVQISAEHTQEAAANAAADACMAWFDAIDANLSRFKPESELSQLNAANGAWFPASNMLYAVVAAAVAAAHASDGLFDPTLLSQLEALGYDRDFAQIAQREIDPAATQSVWEPSSQAWRGIELDPISQRIRLPQGARLDLGGIAKGWAVDEAFTRYCADFPGALVSAGGDLRANGTPEPGKAWSLGIRPPRAEAGRAEPGAPEWIAEVYLSRGAIASSGAARRWWRVDGEVRHHLLDPRTGRPMSIWTGADLDNPQASARALTMVTALAATAERAEIAAKLALLRGPELAARAVERTWERYGAVGPANDPDAGVALIFTWSDDSTTLSANAPKWLAAWGSAGGELRMNIAPAGVEALPPLPNQGAYR